MQKQVVPYLTVSNGVAAIAFYKKGLGGKEIQRMPADDKKRLMHAEVEINGHSLYLSDDFPEYAGGSGRTPEKFGGTSVTMFVQLAVPKEVDQWIARAVKAGAKVTMPAADQFWGDRFGQIVDPFGHAWAFGAPLPKQKKAPAAKKPKRK
ncbi:MAG: VOC family protein [Alphaproteobacteria bacterium]|nr:VOC family protein [Alphaproteobacteria bacterium]